MKENAKRKVCEKISEKIKILIFLCVISSVVLLSGAKVFALTQSEFDQKINSLRSKYSNYSVWNGSFDGGTQCFGFARLMGYEVWKRNRCNTGNFRQNENCLFRDGFQQPLFL